jgi:hypothetical protein
MRVSKKAQLLAYIKDMGVVSSLQIEQWAYNAHNILPSTARRRSRELVLSGDLERFSKKDSALVWYRYVAKEPEPKPELFKTQQHLPLGA